MNRENRIRIAMLGHKRIPSREGGIEIVVEELCTRMVEKGNFVCCYNRKGHHVSGAKYTQDISQEYKGVRIKNVFTIQRKGLAAITSSFFASIAAAFGRYDIVHIHAEGPAVFCWIPKIMGKRVVCTIHGLDHKRAKWGKIASLCIMLGEKNAVKFADEIIVLSKGVQEYFKEIYNRQTIYIPNGVSHPCLRAVETIRDKWNLEKDSYILYLGRIVPEKGVANLIRAFHKVKTAKKLVIAGGSSDTESFMSEMQRLANTDERIVFTGFQQGKILEELYSNAYIYVLPSDLEGMPLSLLEAMSYGNCCLVSDIPECADVVEDKGIVFRKGDVNDLQEKIQMLCDNETMVRNYKKDAADFICEKCSWDEVVEKTLKVYRGA